MPNKTGCHHFFTAKGNHNLEDLKLIVKKTLRYLLKPLSFVPALLVMYMIFLFSAQDAVTSSELSTDITETIVHSINYRLSMNWTPAEQAALVTELEGVIRKCAHFAEYALLGFTLAIPMYTYRIRKFWLPVFAGLICVVYAMLDEYHQTFSAGRSPRLTDVGIDACGAIVGILVGQLLCYILSRTLFAPLSMRKERAARKEHLRRQRERERQLERRYGRRRNDRTYDDSCDTEDADARSS